MRTTELEKRTRKLADLYMATHSGVPRQEAKQWVRAQASHELAWEWMKERIDSAFDKQAEDYRRIGEAILRDQS